MKRFYREALLLILSCLLLLTGCGSSADAASLIKAGDTAYESGDFAAAAEAINAPISPPP